MLRFSFFSNIIEMDGWYIDNVGVIVGGLNPMVHGRVTYFWKMKMVLLPTIDIDASVPNGTWVRASLIDANGSSNSIWLGLQPTYL